MPCKNLALRYIVLATLQSLNEATVVLEYTIYLIYKQNIACTHRHCSLKYYLSWMDITIMIISPIVKIQGMNVGGLK